jgi:hypothetical protein
MLAACGGDDSPPPADAPGAPDAPAAADAPPTPDAPLAVDAPPGTPDAPPDTPDAPPGTPDATAGPDAAPGSFGIAFGTINMFGNCMPIVPPDPWAILFDVIYSNSGGSAASANITSAVLRFDATGETLDLVVTPGGSGSVPPSGMATVTHVKTASDPDLPNDCSHCGEDATLRVEFDVHPGTVYMATIPVVCAF